MSVKCYNLIEKSIDIIIIIIMVFCHYLDIAGTFLHIIR